MTLDRCVELLRELRALDRTRAALALHGTDPDWHFTLTVISNHVCVLRAALSVEPPELIGEALDRLDDELRSETPVIRDTGSGNAVHLASRRIH